MQEKSVQRAVLRLISGSLFGIPDLKQRRVKLSGKCAALKNSSKSELSWSFCVGKTRRPLPG